MRPFLFNEIIESPQDGRIHIVGKNVEWCVDIVGGQLLFAAHSIQHLTAFESVLPALGYESALSAYWQLVSLGSYKHKIETTSSETLSWTSKVVGALLQYRVLNRQQAEKTLAALSEDAIAALLCLKAATVTWHPLPVGAWHLNVNGVEIFPLAEHLITRLKSWQSVSDRIMSPHQRPYCETPKDIYKDVPDGKLPSQTLESLTRLMQGASILQLAQILKQDELQLAQLLYPYIQPRVIKLWPPAAPLDQLPWLPCRSTSLESLKLAVPRANHTAPNTQSPSTANHHATDDHAAKKPDYLIVCIDDNQLVLNKVHSYLDSDRFKLQAVQDPMGSISKICALKPDLILLDISMPRIDGHNLCRILKRSLMFKEIPIIMISSNTSALNKAKAQSVGAADYPEKPFSQAQLIRVLETHLAFSG